MAKQILNMRISSSSCIERHLPQHTVDRCHDDVMKWKHFPRYWPFVRGIHWWLVNSPHKILWRGPLMFSLICVWTNGWVYNRNAGDLRRHRAPYDVTVMARFYIDCLYVTKLRIYASLNLTMKGKGNGLLPSRHPVNGSKFQCNWIGKNLLENFVCWVAAILDISVVSGWFSVVLNSLSPVVCGFA